MASPLELGANKVDESDFLILHEVISQDIEDSQGFGFFWDVSGVCRGCRQQLSGGTTSLTRLDRHFSSLK